MDIAIELLKQYGPWSIGWFAFAYLGNFLLGRYDRDLQSRIDLAVALNGLAKAIEDSIHDKR